MWRRGIILVLPLALLGGGPAAASTPPVYQVTTVAGSDTVGDGGQALTAQLAQPEGLAVDSAGNLYIADAANHRVRMVAPDGTISTIAGNGHPGFGGDNGPAAAAQLNQPYDVALDPAGNLYIADFGNQRVRRIGGDGNIATVAGSGTNGSNGDGGLATSALLLGPRNVALDAAGNLYISEFYGHRVRMVSPAGIIGTVAGIGIAGFSGDGGPASAAQLAYPAGLALDSARNLYIVDSLNVRIRKVAAGSGTISSVCSQQSFGQPYVQLSGIAADPAGDLFIPDSGSAFVWQWTPSAGLARIAGTPAGDAYTGDGQSALTTVLATPVAVTLDPAGDVYVSETRRVRRIAAAGGIVGTVAGDGTFGFGGDGGPASAAVLNTPAGIAVNNGSVYIADRNNARVREILGADIVTVAGNGMPSFAGDGLAATTAGLFAPSALAFDNSGNLYIADMSNDRVRRVDTSGIITTFAGEGNQAGFGGEGDPATEVPLNQPQGLAADLAGNVYVADTNHNRVLQVDPAGNMHTVAGTGTAGVAGLDGPTGLAVDAAGNLYIADTQNHRVQMLGSDGSVSTIAGTGAGGFSGDGGPAAAAQLSSPFAVAVDAAGNLYIADTGNNRVRLVTKDGNIATIAGTGDAGYNGDTGAALDVALYNPAGVAVDSQGNLWVTDTGNNRVRELSPVQAVVTPPPQLVTVSIASSASLQPGPLAPGELFSIFGQGIGPDMAVNGVLDAAGQLSTTLGGVQVTLSGIPAPLFYVQSQQINAQVPYEMVGQSSALLQVLYQGVVLASQQVALAEANPALFTSNNGAGNVVAVNQDGSINSDQSPAPRGSVVVLYATGEGQTSPASVTGRAAQAPYPAPILGVTVTVDGIPANVLFAGEAPGFIGLLQINAQLPGSFISAGDLPVLLTVGTYRSPDGGTIAVH